MTPKPSTNDKTKPASSTTKSTTKRKRAKPQTPLSVNAESGAIEAVGYVRVSTGEQADSGLGLEVQRQKIAAQCEANGWRLIAVYEDAGVTAKNLDRPALGEALDALKPGRVLVVLKLDRLTRSVRDLYDLTQRIEAEGADWASVMEKFDTTTATGRLILGIMVQLSQWERETISERTTDALAVRKSRGERLGTTPLGYRTVENDDGSKSIVEDADEQRTVALARQLREAGLSLRAIAKILTENGHKTKRGGSWEAATIAKLVKPRYVEEIEE